MGRTTPVPASGSLQELARRPRVLSPESGPRLNLRATTTRAERVRVEGVAWRRIRNGLVIAGEVVNVGDRREKGVVEVSAKRRDGTTVRAFAGVLDLASGRRERFSALLLAPTHPESPLLPETTAAEPHLLPVTSRDLPEGREYLEAVGCLSFWGKPVSFNDDTKRFEQVEVHVQSICTRPVPAANTWFEVAVEFDEGRPGRDRSLWLFLEDVPAHGEITELVPVPVKKDMRVGAEAWRP